MITREYKTIIQEYTSEEELNSEDQKLIESAKKVTQKAYAPYSNFKVGASVLLANGEVFSGSNQENAAYPSGLCAERVALFYANSKFPDVAVKSIAICAENANGFMEQPIPPCGSCRQVILESENRFKNEIKVILIGTKLIQIIENSKQLLPLYFDNERLK